MFINWQMLPNKVFISMEGLGYTPVQKPIVTAKNVSKNLKGKFLIIMTNKSKGIGPYTAAALLICLQ